MTGENETTSPGYAAGDRQAKCPSRASRMNRSEQSERDKATVTEREDPMPLIASGARAVPIVLGNVRPPCPRLILRGERLPSCHRLVPTIAPPLPLPSPFYSYQTSNTISSITIWHFSF